MKDAVTLIAGDGGHDMADDHVHNEDPTSTAVDRDF